MTLTSSPEIYASASKRKPASASGPPPKKPALASFPTSPAPNASFRYLFSFSDPPLLSSTSPQHPSAGGNFSLLSDAVALGEGGANAHSEQRWERGGVEETDFENLTDFADVVVSPSPVLDEKDIEEPGNLLNSPQGLKGMGSGGTKVRHVRSRSDQGVLEPIIVPKDLATNRQALREFASGFCRQVSRQQLEEEWPALREEMKRDFKIKQRIRNRKLSGGG